MKISFNTNFDPATGDVIFTTECPDLTCIKVGSDDCRRCRYFCAITFIQQVECGRPVEDENLHTQNSPYVNHQDFTSLKDQMHSVEAGGLSTLCPCNLSKQKGKPVQMKIQFK